MLRNLIAVIAAAALIGAAVLVPGEASAGRGKARGHHVAFHGADVYFPAYYYAGFDAPPIFPDGSAYCWHWFRAGRGWGTAWAC
jgi:hypothetical protein